MFFRIHTNVCINNKDTTPSFIYEIDNETLFDEAKYNDVNLMIERGDVIEGMNIKIPHYNNIKSFELNGFDIDIEYTNIEVCSSSDSNDFSELINIELDDRFYDELVDEIKNVELAYEYDTHYNCYCKTQKVCGCGCDPLHDGW